MQLYILAYILLLAYTRSSKLTYLTCIAFILLQGAISMWVLLSGWARPTAFHFFPFFQFPYVPDSNSVNTFLHTFFSIRFNDWMHSIRVCYVFTFNQFIPYFSGAFIGQMLFEKKIYKFSKVRFFKTILYC